MEAQALLADGTKRSATIRSLIGQLEGSDIIVVLQVGPLDRANVDGHTSLITAVAGARFLRVMISGMLARPRALEMLGHELRHVVEIAKVPTARTDAALAAYIRAIGFKTETGRFETQAALDAEVHVRQELRGYRRLVESALAGRVDATKGMIDLPSYSFTPPGRR